MAAAEQSGAHAQLERILASQALAGSDQLKRMLRHVVERTVSGQAEMLKEYNLGIEVFQRPPDYDPKTDPIVRVQARRLRAKLDEYYATEGANDALLIQIPKGTYVPVFETKSAAPEPGRKSHVRWIGAGVALIVVAILLMWAGRSAAVHSARADDSIAVLPLRGFNNGTRQQLAEHVTELLTTQLAKSENLRVLSRTTTDRYRDTTEALPELAKSLGVRWVVEGGVGTEGPRAYIKLRVVDAATDRKVWADVFDCEMSEIPAVTARAATHIAAAVESRLKAGG